MVMYDVIVCKIPASLIGFNEVQFSWELVIIGSRGVQLIGAVSLGVLSSIDAVTWAEFSDEVEVKISVVLV